MKLIKNFKDVERRICRDLAWYICYECLCKTQDDLNVGFEDAMNNRLQKSIFLYQLEQNMRAMLQKHIFFDEEIELGSNVLNQAMGFFMDKKPNLSTLELSTYLDYLDNWAMSYADWTCNRPVPLKNLIIIPSD